MNKNLPCITLSPKGSFVLNRAAAVCLAPEDQVDGLRVSLSYLPETNLVSIWKDPAGYFVLRNGAIAGQAPTFRFHAKVFLDINNIAPPFATRFVVSPGDEQGRLTFKLSDGQDVRRGKRDSQAPKRRRPLLADPGIFEHVGLTLRLVRNRRRITLDELSRRTMMPNSQLRLYEGGKYLPTLPELSSVLLALDISPAAFFYALAGVNQASAATRSEPPSAELLQELRCPLCATDPATPLPDDSRSN